MFVMTNQYDAGRIYEVVNPGECPLRSGSVAIICAGVTSDGATIGAYSVEVRRAAKLPRDWKDVRPGLYGGGKCRWDADWGHFVTVDDDDFD